MADGRHRTRRGRRRVTVRDVAERAGVAMITVSRALSKPETVSLGLRQRIDAAVRELGYVPNRFAGGLASAHTRIVPVIIPSLSNRVFTDIVRGANDVLGPRGYQILFSNPYYSLAEEEALIQTVLGWMPDGIIVCGVDHTARARRLLIEAAIPVVEAMELGDDPIDINVGLSHVAAGRAMTAHLARRGHRRIGFVGTQLEVDFRAARRLTGFEAALAERGLSPACVLTYSEPPSYRQGGRAVADLLAEPQGIDAVFFANDELAVGAILECQRRNVRVPDDLAIAGFDGLEIGAEINPRLTTVLAPRRRMGQLAAEAILRRLAGEEMGQRRIDVGFQIVVRESA